MFSDQKMLYLCTLAKLCSLKVQIEKGIDCFPQAWSGSVISELNIEKEKVFPALAPEKFQKPLKTKIDNEMSLNFPMTVVPFFLIKSTAFRLNNSMYNTYGKYSCIHNNGCYTHNMIKIWKAVA